MGLFDEKKEEAIFHFGIDDTAKAYLLQTARWTMFMAVIGLISTALVLLLGLLFGLNMSDINHATRGSVYQGVYPAGMILGYVIVVAAYIIPTISLLKFSTNIKAAIANNDVARFNTAMRHQRNMWRFLGIAMIVAIALYGGVIVMFAGFAG